MSQVNYPMFVKSKFRSGIEINATITPLRLELIHASMGIAGEAGELLDAIKKHTMYDLPLDVANVIEEIGDLEFYIQALKNILRLSSEEVMNHNISKLDKRYRKGFTTLEAKERADKDE